MKFYIISIILNIIALFIPVVYYTSGGGGKGKEQDETVTVNLSESVFNDTSQGAGQKSDGAGISAKGNDNAGIQQTSPVSQPQEKINTVNSQNNQKVDTVSPVSQNKTEQPKASKSDNKPPVSQGSSLSAVQPSGNTNSSALASGSTAGAGHSGEGSGHHTNAGSGNGHGSSGTGKTSGGSGGGSGGGRGTGTGSGEGKNTDTDVCNEGKDFTVSYNPNLKYPVAAQRLGNKGVVVVMVKLRFNSSGSVSVISASGGSGVFQQDAKSAASRIKVNIKNPDTLKCTISKPFKFELK